MGAAEAGNRRAVVWRPEHDEYLRSLISSRYSGAQSAIKLNERFKTFYSRNSVIGRTHRLGINIGKTEADARLKGPHGRKPRRKRVVQDSSGNVVHFKFRKDPDTNERLADVQPLHIAFMDLEPCHCRWPYGERSYTYCGHPVPKDQKQPYCDAHYALGTTEYHGNHEPSEVKIARMRRHMVATRKALGTIWDEAAE